MIVSSMQPISKANRKRLERLKQLHPQPRTGMLADSIDLGLDRDQVCPTLGEFVTYAADRPFQGMPFAMPNLDTRAYSTLVHWIAQGAPVDPDRQPSQEVKPQIRQWEAFLNGQTKNTPVTNRSSQACSISTGTRTDNLMVQCLADAGVRQPGPSN
jgi:hypothetical protein